MVERAMPEHDVLEHFRSDDDIPNEKKIGFEALKNVNKLVPFFLKKRWVHFETTRKDPYYISDNPVTMHNDLDHGPYGNIGLG